MSILHLLASDSFITVNRNIAFSLGLDEAIILGELASEHNYYSINGGLQPDGSFYSTVQNIEERTTIKEKRQRAALKNLSNSGIITITVKGLPARRYIKINEEVVAAMFLNNNSRNDGDSSAEMAEVATPNGQGNNNITNNNSNNDTETKREESKTARRQPKASFDALIKQYSKGDPEVERLLGEWLKVRKAKRAAMTDYAIELNLKKLDNLAAESCMSVTEYLKEVICRGWNAFYAINNYNNGGSNYGRNQQGGSKGSNGAVNGTDPIKWNDSLFV